MPGPAGPSTPSGRVGMAAGSSQRVEREPGEDDELVRGVEALDVARRVGLGVAQPLRLGERGRVVERAASSVIAVRM